MVKCTGVQGDLHVVFKHLRERVNAAYKFGPRIALPGDLCNVTIGDETYCVRPGETVLYDLVKKDKALRNDLENRVANRMIRGVVDRIVNPGRFLSEESEYTSQGVFVQRKRASSSIFDDKSGIRAVIPFDWCNKEARFQNVDISFSSGQVAEMD